VEKEGERAQVLDVAVVQPWKATSWLDGVSSRDFEEPPWKLVQETSQLQVMDVRALRSIAGRIPIDGSDKWVIFEISLGKLVPEMV
jgi:hypothetical protein